MKSSLHFIIVEIDLTLLSVIGSVYTRVDPSPPGILTTPKTVRFNTLLLYHLIFSLKTEIT